MSEPKMIPMPWTEAEIQKKFDEGWCVAFPPEDYEGSIAGWCVAMAGRGYPEDYSELTGIMIEGSVWHEVLEECEGVRDGDCSVHCNEEQHHKTCRA